MEETMFFFIDDYSLKFVVMIQINVALQFYYHISLSVYPFVYLKIFSVNFKLEVLTTIQNPTSIPKTAP